MKKQVTQDQVFKVLKRFVTEQVHGGDFDQDNSLQDTLNWLKEWWNKNKNKFKEDDMQQRFTIEEIKNYIIKQSSLGDVLYNLKAEKIVEANQTTDLPLYIKLSETEMRYDKDKDYYYRDAGLWSVGYKYMDGKLVADCDDLEGLHEQELVEITYEEWEKGNYGYIVG